MAFNVHITRIVDNPTLNALSSKVDYSKNSRTATVKPHKISTSLLVNVPAGNVIPIYPVRIFTIQSED